MIINLLELSINYILKKYCKKIDLKLIKIVKKNNEPFNKVNKIFIEAENIIYNEISIRKTKIILSDLSIKKISYKNFLILNNFDAEVFMSINNENLNDILSKEKWNNIKLKIKNFSTIKEEIIFPTIKNGNIYFFSNCNNDLNKLGFKISLKNNCLYLENNINGELMNIPFDKNILFKNINIIDDYINLNFSSRVKLDN